MYPVTYNKTPNNAVSLSAIYKGKTTLIPPDINNSDVLARKAKSLYENGHYNEALDKYDRAIKLNSSSYEAWKGRGIALYLIDRYPDSLEALNRSLELISWIWSNLGLQGSSVLRCGFISGGSRLL